MRQSAMNDVKFDEPVCLRFYDCRLFILSLFYLIHGLESLSTACTHTAVNLTTLEIMKIDYSL